MRAELPIVVLLLSGCTQTPTPGEHPLPATRADSVLFCEGKPREHSSLPLEFERIGKLEEAAPEAIRQPADIARTIRARFDDFQACYAKAAARAPGASAVVQTRFIIAPDGMPRDVCIESATLQDRAALSCFVDEFSSIRFGQAAKNVTIVYPLEFSPN